MSINLLRRALKMLGFSVKSNCQSGNTWMVIATENTSPHRSHVALGDREQGFEECLDFARKIKGLK